MPQVPRVSGPSVELRAAPDVQQGVEKGALSADAFGGRQAATLAQVGDTVQRIVNQGDEDAAAFAEANLKLDYVEYKRILQERRGQDAWGATDDTKRWVDEAVSRHGSGLSPQAQRIFRRSVDQVRSSAIEVAGVHELEQRRVTSLEAAQSRIVADINVAATSPNPLEVDNSRRSIVANVERIGALQGWAPERTAQEKQRQLGTMHTQVLQGLVDRDPINAQAYFDANKSEIPGAGHAEIERTIRIGTTKLQAQAFADKAIAEKIPEADALAMIRKNYSGDQEDTLATVLKARYAEVNAQRERAQNQAAESAWGVVDRGGGWGNIPTTVQAALDPRTSIAIKNHLKEKANSAGVDRTKTDWALYASLRDEALSDPAGFAKKNLVQYFDRLAPAQREQLLDLRTQKGSTIKEARTLEAQIRTTTRELRLSGSEPAMIEKRGQLEDAIRTAVDAEAKVKGKELNADERQRVIDQQIIQYDPGVFSSKKRAYQLSPEERAQAKIVVPDADRKLIQQALRAAGRPVTDQAITDLFKRQKGLQ